MTFDQIVLYNMAEWKNGLAFRTINFSNQGKPVIKISELKNGISSQTQFTEQDFDDSVSLKEGDMLFSWSGNPETSIDVFWYNLPDGWLNQHIFKVVPNKGVDRIYFYYLLKYLKPRFVAIASNKQTTGLGHVTVRDLKEMLVEVPSIENQIVIGSYLYCIDSKIVNNQRINDNLEQQCQAMYFEFFNNNTDISSWKSGTICDLGTVVGGGTPPKSKPEYYTEKGIAWITPKDLALDKSKFISHGKNDISEIGWKKSSATLMPKGSVLFSSRAPIGYIAIASGEVSTNQGFKSIVPHSKIGSAFVYFFLKNNLHIIENMASGTTFKEVSGSVMKSVPVIIPDDKSLKRFTDFCEPIFEQQKRLELENRVLTSIRDTLLPILMSGKIDVLEIDL